MQYWPEFVFVGLAYAVGAIPFAYVIGRVLGSDLRRVGTGNMGAGNLTREAGLGPGITAAILDGMKGLLPFIAAHYRGFGAGLAAVGGLAAVAGHNWSVYFRGRGGRGLATSVGVLVGLEPFLLLWPGLWAVAGWKIGGGVGGFVGWSLLPVTAATFRMGWQTVLVCSVLAVFMLVRRAQGNGVRADDRQTLIERLIYDRAAGTTQTGEELANS